jgi:hypothetical protein
LFTIFGAWVFTFINQNNPVMKTFVSFILVVSFISTAFGQPKAKPDDSESYLPICVAPSYLGMSFKKFKRKMNIKKMQKSSTFSFRDVYTHYNPCPDVKEITYYIDKDGDQPLYEYIIEYEEGIDVVELAEEMYGKANYEDEWLFSRDDLFDIRIWTFQNKIVIVGVIQQTEWVDE